MPSGEQIHLLGHGQGLNKIRPTYFVKSILVVCEMHDSCGLYSSDPVYLSIQFPEPLRFGKESIA